jgi:hypothetical protein
VRLFILDLVLEMGRKRDILNILSRKILDVLTSKFGPSNVRTQSYFTSLLVKLLLSLECKALFRCFLLNNSKFRTNSLGHDFIWNSLDPFLFLKFLLNFSRIVLSILIHVRILVSYLLQTYLRLKILIK